MAILKQRLHKKTASGTYDTIYLETSAEVVKRVDGTTTVESSLQDIESAMSSVGSKEFYGTIGTTWTEDKNTGVKSQSVAIPGVLAKHIAKVDHVYTGDGTSDGYAAFVEAENQYLTYITNGYAETYDGGVRFYIFGDPNTVSIPIIVEVA